MKRIFQSLLRVLDLQCGAAVFVFVLLATGLVCSVFGMRSSSVQDPFDLIWVPLVQVGVGLTLASFAFYLLLIHHRERRVFTICFLFSCLLHVVGACYCTQQVILSSSLPVGVVSAEHSGENSLETVNDYFWEESNSTAKPVSLKDRDYTPESANDLKPQFSQEDVQKELADANQPQTTQEADVETVLQTAREQALQHDTTLPERQESQVQTEKLERRRSFFNPKAPQVEHDAAVHALVPSQAEIMPTDAMETMRAPLDLSEESEKKQLDGNVTGVSEAVLGALSESLQVDDSSLLDSQTYTDMGQELAVFQFDPIETPELGSTVVPSMTLDEQEAMMKSEQESELQVDVAFSPDLRPALAVMAETAQIAPTVAAPFRQRVRANHRQLIQNSGGDPASELVVERGLAYLERSQFPDGHWSFRGFPKRMSMTVKEAQIGSAAANTGATGLALLTFLGAGYTHLKQPDASNDYQETVLRGLSWLLKNQQKDGSLFNPAVDTDRYPRIYSHGMASIALCEAYGMTQDERLREPAQRAIDYIVAAQVSKHGGWRYTPKEPGGAWRGEADTSVSGWQLMALISAKMAGLNVPDEALQNVRKWLKYAAIDDGARFCYMPVAKPEDDEQRSWVKPSYAMTAEGLLMQLYLSEDSQKSAFQSGVDYLMTRLPDMKQGTRDTYYWYYATQVMFHVHDARWEKWQKQMVQTLKNSQETVGMLTGSWSPRTPSEDRWASHGGRHYVTTMHILILEVYYRHLPLFRELKQEAEKPLAQTGGKTLSEKQGKRQN